MNFLGVVFLTTISRYFRLIAATALGHRKKKTIWVALKQVMSSYWSKKYTVEEVEFSEIENAVHTMLADNDFETLLKKI
jgi:hypothetical protein